MARWLIFALLSYGLAAQAEDRPLPRPDDLPTVPPEVQTPSADVGESQKGVIEIADLPDKIQACWHIFKRPTDTDGLNVTLAVSLDPHGMLISSPKLIDPPSITSTDVEMVYERARRAIIRCGARGYKLPPKEYAQWKTLEIHFDNDGVVGQ